MAKAKTEETKVEEPKKDKLSLLREICEKKYGKGVIVAGNTKHNVKSVPTGSYKFDKATDCGGIPIGKIVEIFGPESSGKSTIALHIIAEFQKASTRKCLLADFEYSFDKDYARKIGVKVDELLIAQPDTMEDGYNLIYDYIKSGEIGLVVIDSHTSMVPKSRLEGEIGDAKMAPEARINSDGLKKLKSELEKSQCTLFGISQLRANISKMGSGGNVPTGGNAWKFYPDMRIKIYKELDRENERNDTTIEVVKNKCGKPYGKCEVPIAWGIGFDKMKEVLDIAVEMKIIKKAGAWYSYGEFKVQGLDALKGLMAENEILYNQIKNEAILEYETAEMVTIEPKEGEDADSIPASAIDGQNVEVI